MALTGNSFFFPWEVDLMVWLQARLGTVGAAVLSFFSIFGEELVLIFILGLLYWCVDKKLGKTMGLSVLMGLVWNPMIKNVVLRRRPYFDHKEIDILRVVKPGADIYDISAQGYSFPSGHSTNAVTVYGSYAREKRKKAVTVLSIVIILMVGVSRVAMGAHYPTDVLAGWGIGAVAMLAVPALQKKLKSAYALYGVLLLTAIPGFFFCKSEDYFTSVGLLIGFMAGTLLEEKKVHFENTKEIIPMILRVLGGFAIYFACNFLLKLPFSKEFLSANSYAALLVRCARYALIAFIEFGLYPMVFVWIARQKKAGKAK